MLLALLLLLLLTLMLLALLFQARAHRSRAACAIMLLLPYCSGHYLPGRLLAAPMAHGFPYHFHLLCLPGCRVVIRS